MKMGSQIKWNIKLKHGTEKITHLFVFRLTILFLSIASKGVMRSQNCQIFLFVRRFQLFSKIGVRFILRFFVVKNLIRIKENKIKPGQTKKHNSALHNPIHLKRSIKDVGVVIPMLMVARVNNNRPFNTHLTYHVHKIFIVTTIIGLQIISNVTIDKQCPYFIVCT